MFKIKKASPEDAAVLSEIRGQAFVEEELRYGFAGPEGYDTVENMEALINNEECLKIMYRNMPIGCICIHSDTHGVYEIGPFFISPKYQDRGFGTKAMKFIESHLEDKKIIKLNTAYKNYRNHHFYARLGYEKVGEYDTGHHGLKLWLFEKCWE